MDRMRLPVRSIATLSIALSRTILDLFDVEYRDLKIWVKRSLTNIENGTTGKLGAVTYSHSVVTMALFCITSEIKVSY